MTVNVFEVPNSVPPVSRVAVIVDPDPDCVRVIERLDSTPLMKAPLVPQPKHVRFDVTMTLLLPPLKVVTVLLNWSCAVILIVNAVPAV